MTLKAGWIVKVLGVKTVEVPFQGQGIAIDRYEQGVVYGIHRGNRKVIAVNVE